MVIKENNMELLLMVKSKNLNLKKKLQFNLFIILFKYFFVVVTS